MYFNQISHINTTRFQQLVSTWFHWLAPTKKRFAKSTRISTWFHLLNSTRFQQLVSTWFHRLDPTKNGLQNLHVFQPDFTVGFNLISKLRACWVQLKLIKFLIFRLGLLSLQEALLYKWEIWPFTSSQVIWIESRILGMLWVVVTSICYYLLL